MASVLGKRLGKAMGTVAKEVKAMSQADILAFEESGEITFSGHCLRLTDIKVLNHAFSGLLHLFLFLFQCRSVGGLHFVTGKYCRC